MLTINPTFLTDCYKIQHRQQFPSETSLVYSNMTPRDTGRFGSDDVVIFGIQGFCKEWLIEHFNTNFFHRDREIVTYEYKLIMDHIFGVDTVSVEHIGELFDVGYLPIKIKALREGSKSKAKIPFLTIRNTMPKFYWLTNYLETLISAEIWKPITVASLAYRYRKLIDGYASLTGSDPNFVRWQGHDFSFRGMSGVHDAARCGAAHLLSFNGTDSIPAISYLMRYYHASVRGEQIGGSVPATEHAVMCMGTAEKELVTFKRLICEVYPTGIISIVSDTWDYWQVITEYMVDLRDIILNRNGKVVIRPDSGDPVDIVCGDINAPVDSPQYKGSIECLWEIFGGTINSKGFKELNPKVGLIYGDSITLDRADRIMRRLAEKGFSIGCIVFGIGSFSYQYLTRDVLGIAMKATYGELDHGSYIEPREIFKNPKTDNGVKKSARGLLRVELEDGEYVLHESQSKINEEYGELVTVFENGKMYEETSLADIRQRLHDGKFYG